MRQSRYDCQDRCINAKRSWSKPGDFWLCMDVCDELYPRPSLIDVIVHFLRRL